MSTRNHQPSDYYDFIKLYILKDITISIKIMEFAHNEYQPSDYYDFIKLYTCILKHITMNIKIMELAHNECDCICLKMVCHSMYVYFWIKSILFTMSTLGMFHLRVGKVDLY